MDQISDTLVDNLSPAQTTELSVLVDLEACWENLRKGPSLHVDPGTGLKDLSAKQKAYEAFRVKLVAYNKRYRPAHVPELLLNNPSRLGTWCRAMRNLFLPRQQDAQNHCPLHLLEKAHRWADHIGVRMNRNSLSRATPLITVGDAIRDLEALIQWCDDLIKSTHPGPQVEISLAAPSNNLM
jgi:hypothetical protein